MKTLLEAAKDVLLQWDEGAVPTKDSLFAALREAIRHEEDERRDLEELLARARKLDPELDEDLAAIVSTIDWRRKARSEKHEK